MMRLPFVFLVALYCCPTLLAQEQYTPIAAADTPADILRKAATLRPSERQLRWQELEITGFLHFGMNTFTNREWGRGDENPADFNPRNFDALQMVRCCKAGGIRQIILTAKHHDGFCLWPTETTPHSVRNSPWQNGQGDVVRDISAACRAEGLGFGVYLSPWDRNHPAYGADAYNDIFVQQLTELLTQYGPIEEVWFDGANGEGANGKKQTYDFERWYALIRRLQPRAVIAIMGPDVRWVGTESGYGRETEWSVVPMDEQQQQRISDRSQNNVSFVPLGDLTNSDIGSREKILRARGLVWYPAETDVSIRPGWFYHPEENDKVKTPAKLYDIYFSSVGRNSQLLLNIPPDTRGRIHPTDSLHLLRWKQALDQTFQHNLARDARWRLKSGSSGALLSDGRSDTHLHLSAGEIRFELPQTQTFDVLCLQENIREGQRIESWVLEYRHRGRWKVITQGSTVGYKRLLRFHPVTARQLRLRITGARATPVLAELGLYKMPADMAISDAGLQNERKTAPRHKAIGKPCTLTTPPDPAYAAGGNAAWTNGRFGSNHQFRDAEWLGWRGQDFEGTIDFGKKTRFREVFVDFMQQSNAWIWSPTEVILSVSSDGVSFSPLQSLRQLDVPDDGLQRCRFTKVGKKYRYLRITARCVPRIPPGYPGAGEAAWLFMDEVVVR
jgi:alpha-L-fucosidase